MSIPSSLWNNRLTVCPNETTRPALPGSRFQPQTSSTGRNRTQFSSRPAAEHKVRPYDPYNFHHHLIHRKEAHYQGERVPEEDSFYEEIAKDITLANEVVLIGHATGKSNAADFLKEYLKTHHPDILDESSLPKAQTSQR